MCEIDTYDLEPFTFFSEKTVKARKEHTCTACRGPINPGDKYIKHFSKCDGYITSEKMCPECTKDREIFKKEHHGFSFDPASLQHWVGECIESGEDEDENVDMWKAMQDRIRKRRLYAKA